MRRLTWVLLSISILLKFFHPEALDLNDLLLYNLTIASVMVSMFRFTNISDRFLLSSIGVWGLGSLIASLASFYDWKGTAHYSDLCYLIFYPLFFSSISLSGTRKYGINDILDAAIIGLGISTVASSLILQPIIKEFSQYDVSIYTMIYPIADLTMLALFAARTYTHGNLKNPGVIKLGVGIFLFTLTDTAYLAQQAAYSFSSWLDYGWLLGLVLMGLGANTKLNLGNNRSIAPLILAILSALTLLLLIAIYPNTFAIYTIWPAGATLIAALIRLALAVIDARKLSEEQLLARTDSLTGISNRRRFEQELKKIVKTKFAILIVDLDHFKQINDNFGHEAGDFVLIQVTREMQKRIPNNSLLARIGGDEFGILLYSDLNNLDEVGKSLCEISKLTFNLRGQILNVGLSIGCATSNGEVQVSQLLHRADVAMYHAKVTRSQFALWSSALEITKESLDWENSIEVQYQPILDMRSLQIVGYEALARFIDSDRIMRMPKDFLDQFKSQGLLTQLTLQVMKNISIEASCNSEFKGFYSLNIDASSLKDAEFLHELSELNRRIRLVIELTEQTELLEKDFQVLSELGISCAIDDFGSGFSSLKYLSKFPWEWIKLDRELVEQLVTHPNRATSVISHALALAAQLDAKVVAEGVADEQIANRLRLLGCGYAQGYLYRAPARLTH